MSYCPNCGSYVSPGTNVCSCGTTFGSAVETERERKPTEFEIQQEKKRRVAGEYYRKAKALMEEGRYLEAIEYYDLLIDEFGSDFYVFHKARAYYRAGMYEEALPLFRKSVQPYRGVDNYVIYEWMGDTLNELGRFKEAVDAYERAIDIIEKDYEKSVNFFKSERWMGYERIEHACASALEVRNERLSEVRQRIDYSNELKNEPPVERDYWRMEARLKSIGRQNLITITGTRFYGNFKFRKGMRLKLVKEPGNGHDGDAIAVYFNGKVGYVANGQRTCFYLTSKASEIQGIPDGTFVEYIFETATGYHIARII